MFEIRKCWEIARKNSGGSNETVEKGSIDLLGSKIEFFFFQNSKSTSTFLIKADKLFLQ